MLLSFVNDFKNFIYIKIDDFLKTFFLKFPVLFVLLQVRNILRFVIKRNNVCKKEIVYQNTKFEEHVFVATNMSVLIHSKTTPITES